jgi:hypothetical protein
VIEKADIAGSGKGVQGWFPLNRANVAFDHPAHAPMEHALLIDFVNEGQGPGARVAVELSAESARELVKAIQAALDAGEAELGLVAAKA